MLKGTQKFISEKSDTFPNIEILPFEFSSVKLDKIFTSTYLNQKLLKKKDIPLKIINIFQNYKHFTQFSKISRHSYMICEYFLQKFAYKHVVEDVLIEIKDVLQIVNQFFSIKFDYHK